MSLVTGVDDAIRILDSEETEITDDLGWIISCDHEISNNTESKSSVTSGWKNSYNVDGVVEISGSLEVEITSLKALKVFGEHNKDNEEVIFLGDLPTFTIEESIDGDNYNEFTGVKFTSASIDLSIEESVVVTLDWIARDKSKETGGVTEPSEPSEEALRWYSADVQVDGSTVGCLEGASVEIDRNASGEACIGDKADGEKRLIEEVVEKLLSIDHDIDIRITDDKAWDLVNTDDNREDKTVAFVFDNDEELTLTGARFDSVSTEKDDTADLRTASVDGTALDIDINLNTA